MHGACLCKRDSERDAPLDHIALSVHQELGEVPFDVLGQQAALLGLQEAEQRIRCMASQVQESVSIQ